MTRLTLLVGVAALLFVAYSAGRGRGRKELVGRSGPRSPENEGPEDVLARLELAFGARPVPFSCN